MTEPEGEPLGESPTPARAAHRSSVEADTPLPGWAMRALDEAQGLRARRCFADAIRKILPVLSGPQRAIEQLGGLCTSWERADHEKGQKHETDLGQATAELLQAREEAEICHGLEEELNAERRQREAAERRLLKHKDESCNLKAEVASARQRTDAWRVLKEEKDVELAGALQKVQECQREVTWLRRRSQVQDEALRENAQLKQQLRNMEAQKAAAPAGREEIVRQVAELECGPLRQCASQDRAVLRKKILVKWHPDKQPSSDHSALATQVMQELQNRPEWEM